ncbi:hypothetical protein [Arthrobacter sp. H35-D1]|uniref:hypothetical protein n=1 Tax=Arthrobacter sp. H35-D1 TaxID=3046202 RepID=UPI0024B92E60|nr:hypothetical protein [Arthrobacter sp. H35-D1]MDJ0315182.1 hypothetical protein [Arthrobacter sp. H35-D1]
MMGSSNDPVEISVHFGPDDWTETRLAMLVGSYQDRLRGMGAPAKDIVTEVDKQEDGSVRIHVSWNRRGTVMHTMTGRDASGRLVPDGDRPGLIMYTEDDGETYLEVPEKQSTAPPDPVAWARQTGRTTYRGPGNAVPWPWFAGIGAGLVAASVCIGWVRGKARGKAEGRGTH